MSDRASGKYFLGDVMNIEASVHQPHHVPRHIFVKECVASPSQGTMAEPAYFLIEKHG